MPETIGQRLKKARNYHNLTLEKVEEATHIRLQFLRSLEDDDFSSMPSPVQARGFLRNYSEYLGLDLDAIIDELRQVEKPGEGNEPEVVFEGEENEETEPVEEELSTLDKKDKQSISQTQTERLKRGSGPKGTPASQPKPEPAPVGDTEPISETEASPKDKAAGVNQMLIGRKWIKTRLKKKPKLTIDFQDEGEGDTDKPIIEQEQETSQAIFNSIGEQLFKRRAMLNLTLDEIERHTKLRAYFLRALEEGRMEDLPSTVQTRGMLSNYATFLDLDVDELLFRFAEALQARHRERNPEKPTRDRNKPIVPMKMPFWRVFIAGDLFFGIGTVLFMVILSIWGISYIINVQREQAANVEPNAPSIAEVLIEPASSEIAQGSIDPANTPQPDLPEGTLTIPTQGIDVPVQVNIVVIERTYLRVLVDGEVEFDGRAIPGNAYPFEAQESIEVLAGNAAGLRMIYNQRDLGLMGSFGQPVHFIYTSEDVITPTPFTPPTATNTPFVTSTPSQTPSPTITPTLTPTIEN